MSDVIIYQVKPDTFVSHVTVAVGWLDFENTYLFLKRNAQSTDAGLWGVPGGKLEQGEVPIQALQREVLEETKISMNATDIVHITDLFISKPFCNYTCHMFYYRCVKKPAVCVSPEHISYKWAAVSPTVSLPLMKGNQEILEVFKKWTLKVGILDTKCVN